MRWSQTLIPTLRDIPKEAEATSHQLLLKAGFIRKLSSGIYSYLPLGFRVLQKLAGIIRDEMNRAGAVELLLPALHPADLWRQSGRYEALGQDKISFRNRSDQEFVLGPTHEEVITELAAAYLKTYHAFPKILYQIQTKFRDELRPRFGIIRTKEFMMKDAYSFDADEAGLEKSYQAMYQAYERIFKRIEVPVDIVAADTGIMGGSESHEFMVRSPYGEDHIAVCAGCSYLASQDIAGRMLPKEEQKKSFPGVEPEEFETVGLKAVSELTAEFKLKAGDLVKTILYMVDEKPVAACVRGDHEVHEGKLRKHLGAAELRPAKPEEIEKWTGAPVGFSGPVGLQNVPIIADGDLLLMGAFVTGANKKDKHLRGVLLGRDFKADRIADIRYAEEGDGCPRCGKALALFTAMEVGHVFKLGTRYTKAFKGVYRAQDDSELPMVMGCYGLGVNRMIAAAIEECYDDKGICWPAAIAPHRVHLVTVNQRHGETRLQAEKIYEAFEAAGLDCLYDDRDERAGVKFNDADLIGIPLQVIVSERNLKKNQVEIKMRKTLKSEVIPETDLRAKIEELLFKANHN